MIFFLLQRNQMWVIIPYWIWWSIQLYALIFGFAIYVQCCPKTKCIKANGERLTALTEIEINYEWWRDSWGVISESIESWGKVLLAQIRTRALHPLFVWGLQYASTNWCTSLPTSTSIVPVLMSISAVSPAKMNALHHLRHWSTFLNTLQAVMLHFWVLTNAFTL